MLWPTISRRSVITVAICAGLTVLAYWNFNALSPLTETFNERRNVIYPSAFTFLSILWAAALTIWGLLKSRATRYIERLADNVVFKGFIAQFERRLVYGFLAIVLSFVVYIADLTFGAHIDRDGAVLVVWGWTCVSSIGLIFDSLFTARVVLD